MAGKCQTRVRRFKDAVLSAFLPPVGRRSFRSREMNVFYLLIADTLEKISFITNNET